MKAPANGLSSTPGEGEKKNINSELWHACAGPLVSLPPVGSLVVYFPQGHSEQVAATMQKETDSIPNYPSLPSKLICVLHNVTLHADVETDEVYAQMTLQPVNKYDKDALLASDLGLKQNKQPTEFFCKTLTASDTSTHGGFSVPRRAAEKIFPPLDFSMQPPAQELVAKDLHDVTWTFRHVYRGQPKRHLLTTGWSVFVSTKRLLAGDSVLFIRDEKSQLLLGIRRANRQQPALSSSVLSSDSMHIGVLAAAAHAAANNSPFTIFYNPRASPSEFVVPLAKYNKALYTQVSLGMRFRMMFETEESGVRRYMGTITGISDLDPARWKNSQWRNLQVGWDESTAGERQNRVSIWEIEPVATPFYICPPPFFRPKLPRQPGMPDDESEVENAFKRAMPWIGDDISMKDTQSPLFPGLNLVQWMNMQRNPQLMASAAQSSYFPSMMASTLQNNLGTDDPAKILNFSANALPLPNLQFTAPKQNQPQQLDGVQQASLFWSQQQHHQQQQQQQQHQQQHQHQHQQQQQQQQQQQFLQQHHLQQQLQVQHQNQQQPIPVQTQPPIQQTINVAQLPHQTIMQQHQQPQASIHQPQQIVAQAQLKQNVPPIHPPQQQQQQQQQLQQLRHQEQTMLQNQSHMQQIKSAITGASVVDQQQRQSQSLAALASSQQQTFIVQQPSHHQSFVAQSSPQHQPFGNQFTQIQTTGILIPNSGSQQAPHSSSLSGQSAPILQNMQFQLQQQIELQQGLLQKQQPQLQLLQKMQQQLPQQQAFTQISPYLQSHFQQQLPVQQNQQFQSQLVSQQQLPCSIPCPNPVKDQRVSDNHVTCQVKPQLPVKDPLITNVDANSCSTSPFNTRPISPTDLLNRLKQGSAAVPEIPPAAHPANGFAQGLESRSDTRVKQELNCTKESEHTPYRNAMADQLEASSSATSFCMDRSTEENFSLPPLCIDGEVQADSRNHLPFGSTTDALIAETLLPRDFGSGKDLQNLLATYGTQRDIETEISTAAFSSQSFGLPAFKPGCSSDPAAGANENGVMNRGTWVNQPQRMRTYTKVHKRGSVGRSIDVTRYRGYDDLRRDLACMFGIDGQLVDPHRSDWKLVYVDHENDILLVGDDPWEEFVTCVQSIKILSSAEVQQMSLDGDLAGVPPQNQAGSGSDNGNMWRNQYESNSANSFDR